MTDRERPKRSRLEPLGPLVDALLADLGAPPPATVEAVLAAWETIAGDVAHLTRPASLHHGVLTIEAVTPVAGAQMRYGAARILAALHDAGIGGVEGIEVRLRRGRG